MRLGGMETIKVDVRIIAATNVDLRQMMEEGRFREDLFYRLHVISIQLPPLRERKDDIPLLVQHFLQKYGEENRKTGLELTPDALDLLTEYDWPGNVRELENVIERAVVLTPGPRIGVELIPEHVRKAPNFQMPQFVRAAGGHLVQGRDHRLREAADRVDARGRRRRAEARRRAPAHQADDAERDDQALRHPAAAEAAAGGGDAAGAAAATADATATSCESGRQPTSTIDVASARSLTFANIRSYFAEHDVPAVVAADVVAAVPARARRAAARRRRSSFRHSTNSSRSA